MIVAMGVTWMVTPAAIRLAHYLGAVDLPGGRKIHLHPSRLDLLSIDRQRPAAPQIRERFEVASVRNAHPAPTHVLYRDGAYGPGELAKPWVR